jgi:hypothetical protein
MVRRMTIKYPEVAVFQASKTIRNLHLAVTIP